MRHSLAAFIAFAAIFTVLFSLGQLQTARADITWTGNIDPADPTTWTSVTEGYVGKTADGTLTVDNESDILSQDGYIGYESGVTGEVTVDGAGSTWESTNGLYVGYEGSGMLTISNGGTVTNSGADSVTLGRMPDSTGEVTVDGTDSALNSDNLSVGLYGVGSITIQNGGVVNTAEFGGIGLNAGSTGVVAVQGDDSVWSNTESLYVGFEGNGTLTIQNGGTVTSAGAAVGHWGGVGTVTVTGNGSTWTNSGDLYLGSSGNGTLMIQDGGLITVSGDVISGTSSFDSEFTLAFGIGLNGPGLLDIEGGLISSFTSTLLATVDTGIDLDVGDQFTVVTFDTIFGTFANEPVPTFSGDNYFDWAVHYNANDITLEVITSVLAADFDEDGNVDGDDFLAWQTGFGTNIDATHTSGDADGDGDVDGNDFLRWQTQFGSTAGNGTAGNTAVPEPATLVLLGIGAMGLFGYRRRKQ